MKPIRLITYTFLLTLLIALVACSVDLSTLEPTQPAPATAVPTDPPPPTAAPTPTESPATATPAPTEELPAEETEPPASPTSEPTPTITPTPVGDPVDLQHIAHLGLSGRVLFMSYTPEQQTLYELNFDTSHIRTVFIAPEEAWLLAAYPSPDGSQIVIAYAPPPAEGETQFGFSGLYLIPAEDAVEPQPMLEPVPAREAYNSPLWSPDGEYIYYVHFLTGNDIPNYFQYTIERIPAAGGEPEMVMSDAFWPRLSVDGLKMAYATFNPAEPDINELFISDADGSAPVLMFPAEQLPTVDGPLFSPDGSMLIFSAASDNIPAAEALPWWQRLLGVRVAQAHDVPSDWWRVPTAGGDPEQITEIYDKGMYADFSANGEWITFSSSTGLHLMRPDGTEMITILAREDLFGTLEWVP